MKKTYVLTGLAIAWTLVFFGAFLSIDFEGTEAEGWNETGIDVRIYLNAANHVARGESPYPSADDTWMLGTYPYDLTFARAIVPLTTVDLGVAMAVFHILGIVFLGVVVVLSTRLIKGEGYQPPWWGWALLVVNTSLIGTIAYGNIDVVIIAVGLGLLLALRRKNWLLSGVLIGLLFATKFFWLALLGYAIARRDWLTLIKSLVVAAVFHIATSLLAILSLGWETGWPIYLQRYAFLSRVADTQVRPNYWGSNSLQQTFYNLFGDGGKIPAILAAVILIGMFLFVTYRVLIEMRSLTEGTDRRAITYAFMAWVVALMLQPRLEYAGLIATIVVYCWAATPNRSVRMWSLGALPYVLSQFPTLIGTFMGIDWLNWAVSPAIILALLCCLAALILLLQEQSQVVAKNKREAAIAA